MKAKLYIVIGMLSLMLCACGEQQNENISEDTAEDIAEQESTESMELPSVEVGTENNVESTIENVQEVNAETQNYSNEQWHSAYQAILNDWKTIEQYGDFEYLKMYFDSGYQFGNGEEGLYVPVLVHGCHTGYC